MAALTSTTIAAIGLAVSAVGVGTSIYGAIQQGNAQKDMAAEQKKQEAIRKQQMNLEAMRRKRDIIRQAQMASAKSLATASAQGGAESSGFAGALATTSGQAGGATLATSQNQELGNAMFASNARMAGYMGEAAQGGTIASAGSGLSSLGGSLIQNSRTISRIGSTFGLWEPDRGTY